MPRVTMRGCADLGHLLSHDMSFIIQSQTSVTHAITALLSYPFKNEDFLSFADICLE